MFFQFGDHRENPAEMGFSEGNHQFLLWVKYKATWVVFRSIVPLWVSPGKCLYGDKYF